MLSMLFKVGADATGAERAMAAAAKKGEAAFKSMGKEITGRLAGMFTAGAIIDRITGFTSAVIDNADALDEMSDILGISIEDIQKLQVAANLAGVPLKKLKGILDGITAMQQQAQSGDKKALGIFAGLGLDPARATAMEVLMKAGSATSGKEAAAAADLFGKRFNDVAATMRAMREMGPIELITTEQGKILAKAKDDLEAAKRAAMVKATPVVTAGTVLAATAMQEEANRSFLERAVTGNVGLFARMAARAVGIGAKPKPEEAAKTTTNNQSPPPAIPPAAIPLAMQSDALTRIGLFVGGSGDMGSQLVTIGNYQLSELRAIRNNLEHANR